MKRLRPPRMMSTSGRVSSVLAGFLIRASAVIVTGLFLWILFDLLRQGLGGLSWEFLLADPVNAGREGGIRSIWVSTLLILSVCMATAVPLGVAAAAYLAGFTREESNLAQLLRRSLEVLAAMPSIVFGLFGNALFSKLFGMGFSILSGGLTLACMVLPILIRVVEEEFRAVPSEFRMGAAALGLSRAGMLFRVLLPLALPGITVGLALGVGRALAETAALIFTSGYVDRMPGSLFDSGRSLSIHIFDLSMNVPGGDTNAYASALVLVGLLLIINGITAMAMGKRFTGRKRA